jgi:hypothetical protein
MGSTPSRQLASIPKDVANRITEQMFNPVKEKIYSAADWILNHVPERAKKAT